MRITLLVLLVLHVVIGCADGRASSKSGSAGSQKVIEEVTPKDCFYHLENGYVCKDEDQADYLNNQALTKSDIDKVFEERKLSRVEFLVWLMTAYYDCGNWSDDKTIKCTYECSPKFFTVFGKHAQALGKKEGKFIYKLKN